MSRSSVVVLQQTVTGTVNGPAGPLSGVTVSVVGTSNRTLTDDDGKFSIAADNGSQLRFSSIGFKSQDVRVQGSVMNVTLSLDEA